ncbi:MAG: methylmalonyl-CoA epimerase [Acidobacteria bacterium]|nr:methylmalonyl-CoA epimerase [Acidobacteriota bacterium]
MKINHLGIAVKSIEESLKFYQETLGLSVKDTEIVADQGVEVAMLPLGESRIELLQAIDSTSPIARFIEKRGPGIHHICIEVDDITKKLAEMKSAGIKLIDEQPKRGAGGHLVAFIHPKSAAGVLIELVQRTEGDSLEH